MSGQRSPVLLLTDRPFMWLDANRRTLPYICSVYSTNWRHLFNNISITVFLEYNLTSRYNNIIVFSKFWTTGTYFRTKTGYK